MAQELYTLSLDSIKYITGLINQIVNLPTDVINNTNLADNLTFSNIHIKNLIDQCLIDANTEAQKLVGALTHLTCEKTTTQPTLDGSEINVIYLHSIDGNPPFQQFLKISDTELIDLGSTSISLNDYLTATEIASTYAKQVDLNTLTDEVTNKVDKTSITTTIDSTSTDTQVPSAKAVYNATVDKNLKTYTSIEQLGLTTPTTVGAIYNAIPANSCLNIFASLSSVTDLPLQQGLLSITKISTAGFDIIFKRSGSGSVTDNAMYIGQLKGVDGTGLSWKKVCTTRVEDVPITDITIPNGLFQIVDSDFSYIKYEVVNGIAFVYFSIRGVKIVGSGISRNITVPKLKTSFNHTIIGERCSSNLTILANGTNMQIWTLGDETVTTNYSGCISYPVAES